MARFEAIGVAMYGPDTVVSFEVPAGATDSEIWTAARKAMKAASKRDVTLWRAVAALTWNDIANIVDPAKHPAA